MIEAYAYLKEELIKYQGKTIVAAISGGPDSMALLHFLVRLKKEFPLTIVCAHVHHNLRKESDDEKIFVENYCTENDIVFEWLKIEKYGTENFHKEARTIRYSFFEKLIKKYHSPILLTAHHGDDLIETILMRMVRGSTLRGYGGFPREIFKEQYKMVRPFIRVTKQDILVYNRENQIDYVLDASNDKDKYTRNRYRKYILPALKKENPNVHQKFYKFSEKILEASQYIDKVALEKKRQICTKNSIDIIRYKKEEPIIQKRILDLLLEDIYQTEIYLLTDQNTSMIMHLIRTSESNKRVNLPNHVIGIKAYDTFYFQMESKIKEYQIPIQEKTILPNGSRIEIKKTSAETDNFVGRFQNKDIRFPLYVRTIQKGDKIEVKGLNGHKKVSSIFMEKKLSLEKRKEYPIVVDKTGKIIWIPGLKKSQFDRSKEEKYDIILKYYELKGENNE